MSPRGRHEAGSGPPGDEPWARTSDRHVWRAYKRGLVLTVSFQAQDHWVATVEGEGIYRAITRAGDEARRPAVGGQPRWRYVMRRRRRRGHGVPVTLLVLLLGVLAVIAAVAWMAEHLMVFAGVALLIGGAYYLGQLHERRRARPGQIQPRQAWPEEPAAAAASPEVDFSWGQDDQDAPQPLPGPSAGPDRDKLLADRMSGVRPLWGPS